jgi:hypothetical protein
MADRETPGAVAPDEGERAPDAGGVRDFTGRARPPSATKETPAKTGIQQEPAKAPDAPRKSFEDWAKASFAVAIDARGRASGVVKGKRIGKDSTRNAALVNAARTLHRVPIGKIVTEDEFNKLLDATKAIQVR